MILIRTSHVVLLVNQRVESFGSKNFIGRFENLRGRHGFDTADNFPQRVVSAGMKKRLPESEKQTFSVITGDGKLSDSLFSGGGQLHSHKLRTT